MSRSRSTALAISAFDGRFMTSYLIALVMLAVSLAIFANQIKCPKFDLESEGQGQGGENSTSAILLEMFYSMREFLEF